VRVLVVGADEYAFGIASCLAQVPFVSIEVVAHLTLQSDSSRSDQNRVLPFDEPESWARIDFDEIVIALPPSEMGLLADIAKRLEPLRVPIRTLLDLGGTPIVRDRLFQLGDLQFLDVASTPLESPAYFAFKRTFDVVFSFAALALGLPLFIVIAIAIKLTSPGPVFFRQERVGLNGRLFTMYKFRTMRTSPASVSDRLHTSEADSQKTKLGRWLRKTSLDEIPQFWNVLKGDMSVVGPRPERPYYVKKYMTEILHYGTRHRLKVGITGWAQVNGWRGNTSIECRIDADLYYLQNWTVWLDLRIIAMTIFKGMFAQNA
jgi:exopolysaccharide biosynthesis polyprenyl glycosylphosphotransferase